MLTHEIVLASPSDREKLVVEISKRNEVWAEINQESERLEIELYPRRDGKPWIFPLEEMLEAIEIAKKRLLG